MIRGICPMHHMETEFLELGFGPWKATCGCSVKVESNTGAMIWTNSPNDVGRKDDTGKLRMDLVPFGPLKDVAAVLTFGAEKYADNNWQLVPEAVKRYEAAMLRHFTAYKEGEVNDQESGLPHLAHATCCLMFLQWFARKER